MSTEASGWHMPWQRGFLCLSLMFPISTAPVSNFSLLHNKESIH